MNTKVNKRKEISQCFGDINQTRQKPIKMLMFSLDNRLLETQILCDPPDGPDSRRPLTDRLATPTTSLSHSSPPPPPGLLPLNVSP